MDCGAWITLAAVIVALAIGVASILQIQSLRKRERRDRLLNEIIEWAIEITKWRPKGIFKDVAFITDKLKLQKIMYPHIVEIMENFIETRGRNKYVSDIAIKFDKKLGEAVGNLIDVLESKIELLNEWTSVIADATTKGKESNDEQYSQKAGEQELQIEKLALKVIGEATKIKTRDIG
jgi:hypothetical protein